MVGLTIDSKLMLQSAFWLYNASSILHFSPSRGDEASRDNNADMCSEHVQTDFRPRYYVNCVRLYLFERIASMETSDMSQPLNGSISKEQSELHMAEEESSRLLDLANTIQAQVADLQKYLTNSQQPNPSFEGKGTTVDFKGIDDTRSSVLESLTELQDLLLTPKELLRLQAVSTNTPKLQRSRSNNTRIASKFAKPPRN